MRELREIVRELKELSDVERENVLEHFCRVCHKYLANCEQYDHFGWTKANYCESCEPDPRKD